ncbi:DeoR/GlpR family DNA-binding transcription regulator [Vibrio nigripulchritudo]|uniref:DeoR/GlpR family DNA-binding transcription regulator n=1 Tax=Vibrio nigripulchritudo TaxID=28173 RepID=UPI001909C078|nr:DeoR/GlpR family DNA-binding transcription regulator [Vibrio nigripulchritudo]
MDAPKEEMTSAPSISTSERRKRIADRVRREQFVSVKSLVEEYDVTPVTIRTDITLLLEEHGHFRRVRGGIMLQSKPYLETPFEERSSAEAEMKKSIGVYAASTINSNDTIFLDVGTTTMEIAHALVARTDLDNVTIFTNGLNIAQVLESAWPRLQTVVTGGTVRPMQHSLVEPMAGLMLKQINVGKAFVGCNGVDGQYGVTTTNLPEAEIKKQIIECAMETVLVVDSSKFGRRTLAWICDLDRVDQIIFGGEISPEIKKELQKKRPELIDVESAVQ